MLQADEGLLTGAEEDEAGWLRGRVLERREADAAVGLRVVVVAIGQADPHVVATRLAGAVGPHDAGRAIFENDQVAREWLKGDVVVHRALARTRYEALDRRDG